MKLTPNDYISFGALAISVVALIYTILSNTKKYELETNYRNTLLNWYRRTSSILMQIQASYENDNLEKDKLYELSALIDEGRFYLPNVDKGDNFGIEKPLAYQGYRNLGLEYLTTYFEMFHNRHSVDLQKASHLRRAFTSLMFQVLTPRKYLLLTKKYTSRVFYPKLIIEDIYERKNDF